MNSGVAARCSQDLTTPLPLRTDQISIFGAMVSRFHPTGLPGIPNNGRLRQQIFIPHSSVQHRPIRHAVHCTVGYLRRVPDNMNVNITRHTHMCIYAYISRARSANVLLDTFQTRHDSMTMVIVLYRRSTCHAACSHYVVRSFARI